MHWGSGFMTKNTILGLDIGSSQVHSAILSLDKEIIKVDSRMHFGKPSNLIEKIIREQENRLDGVSFTGIGGEKLAKSFNTFYEPDTITIPEGVHLVSPGTEYVFHLGASLSYFFGMDELIGKIEDSTGTKCGGGSGTLIQKQLIRYFADRFTQHNGSEAKQRQAKDFQRNIKEKLGQYISKRFIQDKPVTILRDAERIEASQYLFHLMYKANRARQNKVSTEKALTQKQIEDIFRYADKIVAGNNSLKIGGRCGVIITSDMIHKQNAGYPIPNILNAMFRRVAVNYVNDVLKTKKFRDDQNALCTGGLSHNNFIVQEIAKLLNIENIETDRYSQQIGAIGVAALALDNQEALNSIKPETIHSLGKTKTEGIKYIPALSLDQVVLLGEKKVNKPDRPVDVVIGVDGGSTTSKLYFKNMK